MPTKPRSSTEIPHSHRKKQKWPSLVDLDIWGEDAVWILQYDNIMMHPGGKFRGCKCDIHRACRDSSLTQNDSMKYDSLVSNSSLSGSNTDLKSRTVPRRSGKESPVANLSNSNSTTDGRSTLRRTNSVAAGAVTESSFKAAFLDVPSIPLYNDKDLREKLKTVTKTISSPDEDWEKRVDAFKRIRSIIISDGDKYPEFPELLKKLEIPVMDALRDLRSQVVREACVTIAFLAERLQTRFNYFSEIILPSLLTLIQNSAKVMSTSAITALKFVIDNTSSSRVLSLMVNNLSSKSKDIRRAIYEMLIRVIDMWPIAILDKRHSELCTSLRKGIEDADPEARVLARRAFVTYKSRFPNKADELLRSLDATYRRMLSDSNSNSVYGSNSSLSSQSQVRPPQRSTPAARSQVSRRSNSAIDAQAVQRATVRVQFAAMSRLKAGSNSSLAAKMTDSAASRSTTPLFSYGDKEATRSRTRTPRYSRSQPTSRSASPSSHLSYHTYNTYESPTPRRPVCRGTGIPYPRSTASSRETSRETSPTRLGAIPKSSRRLLNSERPPLSHRTLQQKLNLDSEYSLSRRMVYDDLDGSRGEKSSDESEASSISSERTASYSAVQASDIIANLGKPNWTDKREALLDMEKYVSECSFSPDALRRITDQLTKIFLDPHFKVYTLFLRPLKALIIRHKDDLYFWLYILLNRLFTKYGTENLRTVESAIENMLDLIRTSFSPESQIIEIFRFIVDPTQTHNNKVKIATLQYLSRLITVMSSDQFKPGGTGRDNTAAVLMKLLRWMDIPEVNPSAEKVFFQLFHLNTPYITSKINELSKSEQDFYFNLVQESMREEASGNNSMPSPTRLLQPSERDDVYRSLRKTTDEIQSYAFGRLQEKESPSMDSGICQLSPGSNARENIEERLASLNIDGNGEHSGHVSPTESVGGNRREEDELTALSKHPKTWERVFDLIQGYGDSSPAPKRRAFVFLSSLIKFSDTETLTTNFKPIIKLIAQHLPSLVDHGPASSDEVDTVVAACNCIYYLLRDEGLHPLFAQFTELLIMKLVSIFENPDLPKSLHAIVDATIEDLAKVLPPLPTWTTFHALAYSKTFGTKYIALRALTLLFERHDKSIFLPHVDDTVACLFEAFNSEKSAIRKAVVFCLVAMNRVYGEDVMSPYLERLCPSRRKLINVYIQRQSEGRDKG